MSSPLAGRRVWVTRPREQASELVEGLERMGAEVVVLPTIAIAPAEELAPLAAAIAQLDTYSWIAFTSAQALAPFFGALGDRPLTPRLAAVGGRTAREVERWAGRCELIAEPATAGKLAALLLEQDLAGQRLLFPRGDRARATLVKILSAAQVMVTDPVVYRTVSALTGTLRAALEEELARGFDWVVLTSPSTWEELGLGLGDLRGLGGARLAAIGPTTAEAIRRTGGVVSAMPEHPSVDALLAAMALASRVP